MSILPKKLPWSPAITTDIVIFTIIDKALNVLLIKREGEPFQHTWALPGGFLAKHETTYRAALRILKEKAGIANAHVEQLYTFDSEKRDPRGPVLTVTYFALANPAEIKFSGKGQHPAFYSVRKLPTLAFDHRQIIICARQRLQAKLEYTNVVFSLLPRYFTFSQLQKAYEIILGRHLDKRNFRKKFLQLDLIRRTNKTLTGNRQRPAQLYQFISRQPAQLKKFF